MSFDLGLRDRRRQQHAAARGGPGQLADRDIGRARQRRGLLDRGAAAIGEHKAAIAAISGDTIGKGKSEHHPGGDVLSLLSRSCRCDLGRPTARHISRACGALGAVAAKLIEPGIEIDAVAAKPALGEDGRDIGRSFTLTECMGVDDHAREPRRQRQRAQPLALRRDATVGVERAELAQQAPGLFQRGRGRRIEKRQRRRIAHAP
ncbi:MAG TPA: hypothetical protein VK433_00330, partial [Stellaceae bacterium]|nr:hypothetical protein [Stellaceae bacterium]